MRIPQSMLIEEGAKECDRMRGLLRIAGIYPEPPA